MSSNYYGAQAGELADTEGRCNAPSEDADETGLYCELPVGHRGDHETWVPYQWPREDEVRPSHNSTGSTQ
jgi:hypothetical protein